MIEPKYKEGGHNRARRLDLGKPHIMWCKRSGEWIRANGANFDIDELALDFCINQDTRWTPRSHK